MILEISTKQKYYMYMKYVGRAVTPVLKRLATQYPTVTIYGPRQSGKTTLVRTEFPSYSYANLEDFTTRQLAQNDPYEFFTRFPEPVIIDEIQEVPALLSTVMVRSDEAGKNGQYIITGSRQLSLKQGIQSLAGRTAIINLLPFSFQELASAGISLERDEQILAGFMPGIYKTPGIIPSEYYRRYVETYLSRDILQQKITNLDRFLEFLQILAGRIGQLVNYTDVANGIGVSGTTIKDWISLLENSHVVYRLHGWYPSRDKQIIKTPKLYFCDTGLVCHLLGIESQAMVRNDRIFGGLFENMVVMEAFKSCYAQNINPDLFFFRNSKGTEIDLIQARDRFTLVPFEIKGAQSISDDFAKNMSKFQGLYPDKVSSDHTVIYSGEDIPSFKGVHYRNYKNCGELFIRKDPPFIFDSYGKNQKPDDIPHDRRTVSQKDGSKQEETLEEP